MARRPGAVTHEEPMAGYHYRGVPSFLDVQAKRLGISPVLRDRARHNKEIYHLSVLLAQLCERYHKARKENGRAVFGAMEMRQIEGTLQQGEHDLEQLFMLAAAADAMLAEAYDAFGLRAPERGYSVADLEQLTAPAQRFGDGTVGVPDAALVGAYEAQSNGLGST